jgi:hypothetical protein
MTDTLKPAELDLEALKKVALEAPQWAWSSEDSEIWSDEPYRLLAETVPLDGDPRAKEGFGVQELAIANHIANFDPPTVLSLLTRIEALEAERDYAWSEMKNAQAYWRAETAHAEAAEAQRDRMREALERAVAWFRDYARQHRLKGTQDGMLKADTNDERADYCEAALSQGSGSIPRQGGFRPQP